MAVVNGSAHEVAANGVESDVRDSALDIIGNTPLVALDRIYTGPGRLLAKCEFVNPGASVKCRSSLHMIQHARKVGDLKPGAPVLEITSGNQGTGLAIVCAVLGHPLTIVMSKGNSVQRAIHIRALGANVVGVPQVDGTYGNVTLADIKAAETEGIKIAKKTGAYLVNQFNNPMNSDSHYQTTGPEIWRQTGHRVDAFIAAVGTAGTFTGTSKYLKEKNLEMRCYVAEPEGCEPVQGCPITKPQHILQGTSYGCVPNLFKFEYLDGTVTVNEQEILEYKRLIGEKEGLYVGYSSAANVAAAVKLLKSGDLPKDAWLVTMLNDTGLKYPPETEQEI